MAGWGYEKGFVIEHDPTKKKRISCRDCIYYEKSDQSCLKRPLYLPVDGYNSWRNCKFFDLSDSAPNLNDKYGYLLSKQQKEEEKKLKEAANKGKKQSENKNADSKSNNLLKKDGSRGSDFGFHSGKEEQRKTGVHGIEDNKNRLRKLGVTGTPLEIERSKPGSYIEIESMDGKACYEIMAHKGKYDNLAVGDRVEYEGLGCVVTHIWMQSIHQNMKAANCPKRKKKIIRKKPKRRKKK